MLKALLLCALLALPTLTPRAETDAAPAPRPLPWDCETWAAFSHEDRTTQILESLAANRGKALYCGVDQSETFTKAETWEAGRDRNERDDTVYFGEEGQFRGFIAAQEGYLTDGESGVTGVSIDRIFEFPRETYTRPIIKKSINSITDNLEGVSSCGIIVEQPSRENCLNHGIGGDKDGAIDSYMESGNVNPDWKSLGKENAQQYCKSIKFTKAKNVKVIDPGITLGNQQRNSPVWQEENLPGQPGWIDTIVYQVRAWTATCTKLGPIRKNTPPTQGRLVPRILTPAALPADSRTPTPGPPRPP